MSKFTPIQPMFVGIPHNGRVFTVKVMANNKATAIDTAKATLVKAGKIPAQIDVRFLAKVTDVKAPALGQSFQSAEKDAEKAVLEMCGVK